MSLKAMVWVLEESEAKLGDRLVLLTLAEHADDDGQDAFPSVATISRKTRLSERAVHYALRSLEDAGRIARDGKGPHGTTNYRLIMGGADPAGVQSTTASTADSAPEPSLEPDLCVEGDQTSLLTAKDFPRARPTAIVTRSGWKVDRKPVTEEEEQTARAVLAVWNAHTDQTLSSQDWLAKIVMRIREHPLLHQIDHETVITAVLNDPNPWWSGHPSPSIVYGNGAQFERCLTLVRNGHAPRRETKRYGRGVTPGEALRLTRGLR